MMLEQLLANLNSRDKILREDAERCLRALTPEELLQFSRVENKWFKKWSDRAWVKAFAATICTSLGLHIVISLLPIGGLEHFLTTMVNGVGYGIFMGWAGYFRFKQQPYARHALALAIGDINDTRFAPVLMTMLLGTGCSPITREAVGEALTRLLPQLCLEDTYAWTYDQRDALRNILKSPLANFPLCLAVLNLLRDSKDDAFLRQVRKLANIKTTYSWGTKPKGISVQAAGERAIEVKQAAQECLRFLEQRQQKATQPQTLLRASMPVSSPDTLLRAATAAPATEHAEQLLRAGGEP